MVFYHDFTNDIPLIYAAPSPFFVSPSSNFWISYKHMHRPMSCMTLLENFLLISSSIASAIGVENSLGSSRMRSDIFVSVNIWFSDFMDTGDVISAICTENFGGFVRTVSAVCVLSLISHCYIIQFLIVTKPLVILSYLEIPHCLLDNCHFCPSTLGIYSILTVPFSFSYILLFYFVLSFLTEHLFNLLKAVENPPC